MKLKSSMRLATLAFVGVAVFALAIGCSDDDDDPEATGSTGGSPAATAGAGGTGAEDEITGTVSIEGSSTVQPVTLELVDLFNSKYPDASVNPPSGLGSGAGITAFINKEVDIAQSSRPISDDEKAQATAAGLEVFETKIFDDALVIVVHPNNTIADLSVEQIARIFAGEITDWSEIGGTGGQITLYTRNEESGTFAYLEEEVIQDVLGDTGAYSDDINKQASAPAGLSAVAGDPSGIFYAGLGNLAEIPAGSVKVVTVEGVEATAATVSDGSYPISRGLLYYTNGDPKNSDNAALAAFIELALSEEGQAIGENLGFIPVD
jgi:phosphate transport system substrate-binding protein